MLMCVYRHYSKGSEMHAERGRKGENSRCVERNAGKEKQSGRKSLCSV